MKNFWKVHDVWKIYFFWVTNSSSFFFAEVQATKPDCEALKFVKTQYKPLQTVTKHWEATFQLRLEEFNKKNIPIHEYFALYPVLGTSDGAKLVSQFSISFQLFFPTSLNFLFKPLLILLISNGIQGNLLIKISHSKLHSLMSWNFESYQLTTFSTAQFIIEELRTPLSMSIEY